ncbi:T9SS type A sorting domain-containing protein [bacterium]
MVFYDRRNHEYADTDVYLAVSRDGGNVFENYEISDEPFIPKSTVFMGDYTNVSAHNDVIRPVWARMDNFKDVSIWTAIIDPDQLTDVEDQKQSQIPEELTIRSVYPNPFNASTWIHYSLPGSGQTRLAVYDLLGKERCVLVQGYQSQGDHAFRWNGEGLPSGVYFVRLEFGQGVRTDKVILLK